MKCFIACLCAGLMLFSCGKGTDPKKIKIGLSLESLVAERWGKDRDLLAQRIKELGAELIVQVANGDDRLQNEQCENLLTMGVKVLIIVPHNAKVAATAVESAHKAGVPVISYDRVTSAPGLDLWVSFDNEKVGELQAQYLVDRMPKGTYFLLEGAPTDYNATLFRNGHLRVLQPYIDRGDIKVALDQWCKDWQPIEALKHTENGLTRVSNKVDAILSSYDGLSAGAAQALAEQKLSGKVLITGQDAELPAIRRILDGTQTMTVYKPLKKLAAAAAEAAMTLAKKEKPAWKTLKINNGAMEVPVILLDPIVVDKSNIDSTVIADGYLTREQVYGK